MRICEYETPAELRRLVTDYVEQYNAARPHQSLGYDTPSEWYYSGLAASQAAALSDAGSLSTQDFVSKQAGHFMLLGKDTCGVCGRSG